jgi:hypothetical protein
MIRAADPELRREVWLSVRGDDGRVCMDVAGPVAVDEQDDLVISGEEAPL